MWLGWGWPVLISYMKLCTYMCTEYSGLPYSPCYCLTSDEKMPNYSSPYAGRVRLATMHRDLAQCTELCRDLGRVAAGFWKRSAFEQGSCRAWGADWPERFCFVSVWWYCWLSLNNEICMCMFIKVRILTYSNKGCVPTQHLDKQIRLSEWNSTGS